MINNDDRKGMALALQAGAGGIGWNSPRPSVGCVLMRDGEVIGQGHTQRGDGQPHGEVMAIRDAAKQAKSTFGATAYVTLEPCSHYATTPPCSLALIEAGVKRVVVGVRDPNKAVDGNGFRQLREAGIEVAVGVMARECAHHQEHFLRHISTGAPFVTLKTAMSLDGKIALQDGTSQWITGDAARRDAHFLRHRHDAVLVGSGTALADDPQLSVRLEGHYKQPARVLVDSRGVVPPSLRLFDTSEHDVTVYVATTAQMDVAKRRELEARGVKVLLLPESEGRVDLNVLFHELYLQGIYSILVEGGAALAGALLRARLVDKMVCYVAPLVLGEGIPMAEGLEFSTLADALRLDDVEVTRCGEDTRISGYLEPWASQMRQLWEEKNGE